MTDKIEENGHTKKNWWQRSNIVTQRIILLRINNKKNVSHVNIINKKNWNPNQVKWLCDDVIITYTLVLYLRNSQWISVLMSTADYPYNSKMVTECSSLTFDGWLLV